MAEYSRLASGKVLSNGGDTLVRIPFIPNYIHIFNQTRAIAQNGTLTTPMNVTEAFWETDMGQGTAAFTSTSQTADISGFIGTTQALSSAIPTDIVTNVLWGHGFSTVQAGLSLQFGPVYAHNSVATADFTISKAFPAVVDTVTPHNLVSGNWVIFSNLYQTATTGMQQLAGVPFEVIVTSPTQFTIPWDTSGTNYTAFDSSASLNNAGSFKKILYPALYVPGVSYISDITLGTTTIVETTAPHNFVVGQEVAFRIPSMPGIIPPVWGPTELNSLPNVLIPGSPIYGYVVAVTDRNTVVVNIDSSTYTAWNVNFPFASFVGKTHPQIVAVGDVNTGGWPISAGSDLYPSPFVQDGFGTSPVRTINGPAIQGAYINSTFMGFVIGRAISGSAEDVIYWRAYMHDKNYP